MGNPLQDAVDALGEIINDVQTQRTRYEEDYIRPLKLFPKNDVDGLDIAHDQCIQQVQTAMGKLYGPGSNFKGELSDTVATVMGDYFDHENQMSAYADNAVSEYMLQLAQLCQTTVQEMEPHLEAIKGISMSNVFVGDIIHSWTDLFTKGPLAALDDIQIGPFTLGQLRNDQHGQPQSSQSYYYPQQGMRPQHYAPQQQPGPDIWEIVASVLARFAVIALVANLVTEGVKQIGLEWHLTSLGWSLWQWMQRMAELHNLVMQQNMQSWLKDEMSQISNSVQGEGERNYLGQNAGLTPPNLKPQQQDLAKRLYQEFHQLYGNLITLAEIEYIISTFPKYSEQQIKERIFTMAAVKQAYPKIEPGYLLFFVLQGATADEIKQDMKILLKARQNSGKAGTINYTAGQPMINPVVDFLVVKAAWESQQAEKDLLAWKKRYLNGEQLRQIIPNFDDLPPPVKTWLTTLKSRTTGTYPSTYHALFGTALQKLVEYRMINSPSNQIWYNHYRGENNYKLFLDQYYLGKRPDVRATLKGTSPFVNGALVIIDYTTIAEIASKSKYAFPTVRWIVVITHGPPDGPVATR